jgi:hypothetical protein
MKRFSYAAAICASLLTAPAFAADQAAVDPDLAQFRAAYTSAGGLAYVVINDAKGDHIYRYGDASRMAAKKSPRGYMVFTCNAPRVLIPQRPGMDPSSAGGGLADPQQATSLWSRIRMQRTQHLAGRRSASA